MTPTTPAVVEQYRAAAALVSALPTDVAVFRGLSEADLLQLNQLAAGMGRSVGSLNSLVAGEIAHRSAPALGSSGLAQRAGFRTPEQFVKITTGISGRDASRAVRVGRLVHDTALAGAADPLTGEMVDSGNPWLRPLASALRLGSISAEAVDAISVGIGSPNSAVSAAQLEAAVAQLCSEATSLDVDGLLRRARGLRDELDAGGVAVREAERRELRSFRISVLPDGMGRAVWVMDPETLASVKDVYDRATSPKLGGVRFVAGDSAGRAEQILADPRTPQQLASDAMEQVLRLGADADPQFLLGSGAPVVKVIVTKAALDAGQGLGRLEGHPDPVSTHTVERLRCAGDMVGIVFDQHGQPLDVGREHRLFTKRQRLALAVRDGGCRAPGCDRPPSWCEAHHVQAWGRDRGGTDVANGILLCKHHHLLFHTNGWQIRHEHHSNYWLIPPPDIDPNQTPRAMPSKSPAMRDLKKTG
jgi:hypothetical protein